MSWAWLPATAALLSRARATGWGKLFNCEVKLDGADALAFQLLQPAPLLEGGVAGSASALCGHAGARQFGRLHRGARLQGAGAAPGCRLFAGPGSGSRRRHSRALVGGVPVAPPQ